MLWYNPRMNETKYYLYKIVNNVNDKIYIGVTVDPYKRWYGHMTKNSKCNKLRNAIRKHGKNNFEMIVLCCGEAEYILDLEVRCIAAWDTVNSGYNLDKGGRGVSKANLPNRPVMESPEYIAGFWFPTVDMALEKLQITIHTYRQRKVAGSLGNTKHNPKKTQPVYFMGFWYPSTNLASEITGYSKAQVHKTSKKIELYDTETFSIKEKCNSQAMKVEVDGILYESIRAASRATGYTERTIKRRISRNIQGYK
jgi:hypothetical protein